MKIFRYKIDSGPRSIRRSDKRGDFALSINPSELFSINAKARTKWGRAGSGGGLARMIETENQLGSRAGSGLGQYEEAAATITDGNGGGGDGTDDGNGGSTAAEATTLEDAGEETVMKDRIMLVV